MLPSGLTEFICNVWSKLHVYNHSDALNISLSKSQNYSASSFYKYDVRFSIYDIMHEMLRLSKLYLRFCTIDIHSIPNHPMLIKTRFGFKLWRTKMWYEIQNKNAFFLSCAYIWMTYIANVLKFLAKYLHVWVKYLSNIFVSQPQPRSWYSLLWLYCVSACALWSGCMLPLGRRREVRGQTKWCL